MDCLYLPITTILNNKIEKVDFAGFELLYWFLLWNLWIQNHVQVSYAHIQQWLYDATLVSCTTQS